MPRRTSIKTKEARRRSELGVSAIEFTLLLPLLLTLLLVILQVALIVQAKFVVNHAVFAALRSAIVTIPASIQSAKTRRFEPHNQVALNDPESPKMKIIRRAAAWALTSISPVFSGDLAASTGTVMDPSLLAPLGKAATAFSALAGGGDFVQQILDRAHYAYNPENTKVEIIPANEQQRRGMFGDHDEITVRVTFRYFLTVPIAARIFGRPYWGSSWGGSAGRYIEITEQYTLQNEGEPIFPETRAPRGGDVEMEMN